MPEADHPVAIITIKAFSSCPQNHMYPRVLGNGIYFSQMFAVRAFYKVKIKITVVCDSIIDDYQ